MDLSNKGVLKKWLILDIQGISSSAQGALDMLNASTEESPVLWGANEFKVDFIGGKVKLVKLLTEEVYWFSKEEVESVLVAWRDKLIEQGK